MLLKESVKHLGRVGDVVEVSAGYARNYLLPNDLAVAPTPGNIRKVEERRKEIERLERERRAEQERTIAALAGVEVHLERRANEQGHLFGSVSATDIARQLQAQGYAVNPDDINLPGKLDRVADYVVTVAFAEDLKTEIKVWVHADAESKAAMEAYQKAKAAEAAQAS
ncbi:MAG: 50S ribosomal protein L9 [Phycisphaerae bacterium]|nr:50S ribosomal protein L9 [Phycisphaerae bacterium]